MAGNLAQDYKEKNPASVLVQRTPKDLADEYERKADMGQRMYLCSLQAFTSFTGYKPENSESL